MCPVEKRTITIEQWDKLKFYAIQGTMVEQLMATETLIYLFHKGSFHLDPPFTSAVFTKITNDPSISNRLKKNYMLLIGHADSSIMHKVEPGDDPMLDSVIEYVKNEDGEVVELFAYEEPTSIREEFYSGRYEGDGDYPT